MKKPYRLGAVFSFVILGVFVMTGATASAQSYGYMDPGYSYPVQQTPPAYYYGYDWNQYYDYQYYDQSNWGQYPCGYWQYCPTYGQAPVISGVSGPTQLNAGQSGTWTVNVQTQSSYLSYSVVWGDEQNYGAYYANSPAQDISSTGTFTHSYARAGTYSPRFTVTDQNGQSASASASVVVSGSGGCTYGCTATFTASPSSGPAPLNVNFTARNVSGSDTNTLYVEFGDGSTEQIYQACPMTSGTYGIYSDGCIFTTSHTYSSAGSYTARLMSQPSYSCPPGMYCMQVMPAPVEHGRTTVTVTSTGTGHETVSANPTSGAAPLSTEFTVSNANSAGYSIEYGDGSSEQMNVSIPPCAYGSSCYASARSTHTYVRPGTYTATVSSSGSTCTSGYYYCPMYMRIVGSVTVTVTGSQNLSFTAAPTNGPAPLDVTFSMPSQPGSPYDYIVDFDDGEQGYMYPGYTAWTTAHTFTRAGTYHVKLRDMRRDCFAGGCDIVGTATITVSPGTSERGTVRGQVTMYGCPAQNMWWDNCYQSGFQTTVYVYGDAAPYWGNAGQLITTVQTDSSGYFTVQLASASYTLQANGGTSYYPSCQPVNVSVYPGSNQYVNIVCDNGIR